MSFHFKRILRSQIAGGAKRLLWSAAVCLALIEPKQIQNFFPGAHWLYPEEMVLAILTLMFLVSRKRSPRLPVITVGIYLTFVAFVACYLLTSVINAAITPSTDPSLMVAGVGRVALQYAIGPPLLLGALQWAYADAPMEAAQSFLIPLAFEAAILAGGLLLVAFRSTGAVATVIDHEMLVQSWIIVGGKALFLPKWGGTFAETQELGLFVFLSYLLADLHSFHASGGRAQGLPRAKDIVFMAFALLSGSKGVALGLIVYRLFRRRRYLSVKLLVAGFCIAALIYFSVHRILSDSSAFLASAFRYNSVDERLFHLKYGLQHALESPIHLFVGFGARQYGVLLNHDLPAYFPPTTTPVSLLAVLVDSGILGFLCYMGMQAAIWEAAGEYRERLVLVAAFVANLWMPDWSMNIYVFFLITLVFVIGTKQRGIRPLTVTRETVGSGT